MLLALLLYVAVVPGLLAHLAWFHAVKELGPTTTSLFVNLLPPATLLLAVAVLGEKAARATASRVQRSYC